MKRCAFAVLVLWGCGCGGPPPKLSEVQAQVFSPSCTFSACHSGLAGAGGLNLESGNAYAQLVGRMATGTTGRTLVKPSDSSAAGSYLIEKLTATAPAAGVRMPSGGDPLEPNRLQLVKDWISAGAQNN
jgi:hypothetical protein